MKRTFLFLAMLAGLYSFAFGAEECFDDAGWQQGPSDAWFVNWDKAAAEAKKSGKPIFVLKTGSDWCGWCIRLRKNVLNRPEFADFAKKNLVLLYLDSPSKNPLGEEQKRHNQQVSRKLSLGGGVPNAAVVTADGKKLGAISGGGLELEDYLKKLEGILKHSPEENGSEVALTPRQNAGKMPSQYMPMKGLLASFGYGDGRETNTGYGEARRENDHVEFVEGVADYDGVYKYSSRGGRFKKGDRFEEDYVIPELNFDRFTVACSFRPAHTNNWGQYFFRLGQTCYSILEVSLSGGKVSVYGRKLKNLSAPYVDKEWNWLVVSVDVVNREAWLSVNGCEPVSTSLPMDFFWFIPSDRVLGDGFRRLTFGNWQCGRRYCGQVDDLMVYDRALGREEFANVCKRTAKAEGRAVASFEKSAPARLPELRDDCWLFIPHDEQSVYWNGAIRTKGVSLKVRREADGLCVEPPGGIVDSALDLTLPVVDVSGRPLSIVGIGSECDPYCIRARKASLSEIRLPDTLKTIRKNAFAGCLKLESIVIPENVREIGSFAFADCGQLMKLEIRARDVTIAKDAFSGNAPIMAKLPDLSKPVGPLRVLAGKDEDENRSKGAVLSQAPKDAPVSGSWQKGPSDAWFVKWDDAVAESKKTKRPIYVLSTGSDWCGWCIRLLKNVLSKPEFETYAKENLVLLYLDSPSKTPLCDEQKKHNREVSRKLSLGGGVPNATVVTADGKKLGAISGGGLELDAYLQKLGEIIGKAGVTDVAVEAKVRKAAAARTGKSVEPIIKNYKLHYANPGEVASMLNQMFKDCAALGDERMGIVSVKMKPDALRGVEEFIESLDIRPMELKLDVKVLRVKDVENIDAAGAKLRAEPDGVEVAFSQNVVVRENYDFSTAGLFTMCGKSTVFKFDGQARWNYSGGRTSVNWKVVCSNESDVACALTGMQVVDGGCSATLGGCMVEERSGLFSFLCPSGVNTAYLFQLTVEDVNQDQSADKVMADIRNLDKSSRRNKHEEEDSLDKANQEALKKLAAQIRKEKFVAAEKCIKADEREKVTASKTNQVQRYSWKYEIKNGAVEIHGVTPSPTGDLEIPETIEGHPVVSVGGMRNGQMSSIKFPSTLKWIGESAFENCRHLKRLELPGALERIGGWAFARCERLEAVRVPSSVSRLAGNSFCGSKKIGCFLVDPENPNYRIENGMLLERDAKLVMGFPMMIAGPVRIPDGIVEIGNEAFAYCDQMTNVSIASSVRTIARQAFLCCDGLTDVSVPEGVKSLGSRAFSCCKRLQSLGLPASLIKCEGNPVQSCPSFKTLNLAAGNGVFMLQDGCLITMSGVLVCMANAHEQKKLCMPQGIAEIGDGVFWDCNNLEVAVIPEGVVRIGGTAFHGCDRLRELTLPLSLRQIGNLAFQFCPELKSVNVPAGVTNIASQAFAFNRKLEEVTVAGSCTIGTSVFAECPNLSNVRLLGESIRLTAGSMPKELAQGVLQFPQGQRSAIFKGPIALDRMQSNRGR